jgi:O-antigen/teichoic acid export membrane protein
MIRTRQLAPVTGASAATAIWLAVLGLITTPYLLDRLGPSAYAVFALITIVVAYLSNLEFGFGHATTRFLAQARASGDRVSEARIVGMSLLVFAVCGAVAGVLAFAAASPVVESYAHFPAGLQDDAADALRLGAVVLVLTFLSSFSSATLQACGSFRVLIGSRAAFGTLAWCRQS